MLLFDASTPGAASALPDRALSPQIDLSKVLIVPKLSKLEWDMRTLSLTFNEVLDKYRAEGANADSILDSYNTQQDALGRLKTIFDLKQFVDRDQLKSSSFDDVDLVI